MKTSKNILKIKKIIILLCIILLVLIIGIVILYKQNKNKKTETEIMTMTEEQMDDNQTKSLKPKNEIERIKIYLTQYLKYIENDEYEKAYSLLNQDFKDRYFPTLEHYIFYVEKNYFDIIRIEYLNVQRQGKYYILEVNLSDIFDELNIKTQNFVIYEKNWNEFELSFQAE